MPVRKSGSVSLHNLWNVSDSNSVHRSVTLPWPLYSLQSSFQTRISGALFRPYSVAPRRCWTGRLGCCQHHLCHLSCSAAGCSSCDKTWVYSGAKKILDYSIWLSADHWAPLSPGKSQPIFLSVSQGQSWSSSFLNLFFAQLLWNSCNMSTNLFHFARVKE